MKDHSTVILCPVYIHVNTFILKTLSGYVTIMYGKPSAINSHSKLWMETLKSKKTK